MPWRQSYAFNLIFITEIVFWILATNVGLDRLAFNLRLDSQSAIARTVILQCLTSLIVGLLGACAFSLATLTGSGPPGAGPAADHTSGRRSSSQRPQERS
jgi:hypothetical protein